MIKKLIIIIILLIPIKVKGISASSYVVMDLNSNRVLQSSNKDESRLIASITKIMTAIVAIENADIKKKVTIDESILASYGSNIYIEVGEILTLEDLLYGLMLRSGNDAAIAIANNVSGSMDKFVLLMNEYAKKIKMTNTYFVNSHGLEESDGSANHSSSYDMAILTSYAMKNNTFKNIFGTKTKTVKTNKKTYTWRNKNRILHTTDYINGGKTGFTEKARRTLVTTASKDNKNIVIVTLNDGNDFQDHLDLYNNAFKKYENIEIINKDNYVINNEKYCEKCKLFIKESFSMLLKKDEINDIKININLVNTKRYKNNDKIGYIEIKLKDKTIKNIDVFITREKSKSKSLWEIIKGWFKW